MSLLTLLLALVPTYATVATILWFVSATGALIFLPFWAYALICKRARRGNHRSNLLNILWTGIGWMVLAWAFTLMGLFQLIWADNSLNYLMPQSMAVVFFAVSLITIYMVGLAIIIDRMMTNNCVKPIWVEKTAKTFTFSAICVLIGLIVVGLLAKYQEARWIGLGLVLLVATIIGGLKMYYIITNAMARRRQDKANAKDQEEKQQMLKQLIGKHEYEGILHTHVFYLIGGELRSASAERFLSFRMDPRDAPSCWLVKIIFSEGKPVYQLGWRGNRLWTILSKDDNLVVLRDFAGESQELSFTKTQRGEIAVEELLAFVKNNNGVQSYRRGYVNAKIAELTKVSRQMPGIRQLLAKMHRIAKLTDEELAEYFAETDRPDFGLTSNEAVAVN